MNRIRKILLICLALPIFGFVWGFYGHKRINRLAVFTLPPAMIGFYKKNIEYLAEESVAPDRRRYAVEDEAPRHYIDLDEFGDAASFELPKYWAQAVEKFGEDTLMSRGIVPWQIQTMYNRLKDAFMINDPSAILRLSAELGHYVADANVPLHTTSNYDGQLTGQDGLHGFWESRLPELFAKDYTFFVGKAGYVPDVAAEAWLAVRRANAALDSVLTIEKDLYKRAGTKKYSFETRGRQTQKVVAFNYSRLYHEALHGMVERQMRRSIKMTGDLWFTAWVDAGQPDLKKLIDYVPTEEELAQRKALLQEWKKQRYKARAHSSEESN